MAPSKRARDVIRSHDPDDVLADITSAPASTATVEERARQLEALCRMAAEQVAQHPDPQRTLDWQDPISPESKALLARLRRAS